MNFNLVVDTSNFKPFSFLEKVAPLLLYKDAYEKLLEKMEKFADTIADLDPDAFDTLEYKDEISKFHDTFRGAADRFSKGMTALNLLELNRIYTIDKVGMKKYQDAIKLRNEWIARALAGGTDLRWNIDGSADSFVGRSAASIKAISAKDTMAKAATVAKGSYETLKDVDTVKISKDLGLGIRFWLQQQGDSNMSMNDVIDAVAETIADSNQGNESSKAVKRIASDLKKVIESTGVNDEKNHFDLLTKEAVANDALLGFIAAFTNEVHPMDDKSQLYGMFNGTYTMDVDDLGRPIVTGYNKNTDIGSLAKKQATADAEYKEAAATHMKNLGTSLGTSGRAVKPAVEIRGNGDLVFNGYLGAQCFLELSAAGLQPVAKAGQLTSTGNGYNNLNYTLIAGNRTYEDIVSRYINLLVPADEDTQQPQDEGLEEGDIMNTIPLS